MPNYTPKGIDTPWDILEWTADKPLLESYDNVVKTVEDLGGSWRAIWLEIDLELPGWVNMDDPWTSRLVIDLVNPPAVPASYTKAYSNPSRFIGMAFRAGGKVSAITIGLNTVSWLGTDSDANPVETGEGITTIELANTSLFDNSFISIKDESNNWYYACHRCRDKDDISEIFYNNPALDNVNVAVVVITPVTNSTQINFTQFYIGSGCFPKWKDPVVTRTQPKRVYVPSTPFEANLKAEAEDVDGAKLWYRWHLLSAPAEGGYVTRVTNGYTQPGIYKTDTIYSSAFTEISPSQDWWVEYNNGFYKITSVGSDSITVDSRVFPPGESNINLYLIESLMSSHVPVENYVFTVDTTGTYLFRLEVTSGARTVYDDTVVMAYSPDVAFSIIPSGEFIWNYLSDIWHRVENREYLTEYFSALFQHGSSMLLNLWHVEAGGELMTIPPRRMYRWQIIDMEYKPEDPEFVPALSSISMQWTGPVSGECSLTLYDTSQEQTYSFTLNASKLDEAVSILNKKFQEDNVSLTASSYNGWLYIQAPFVIEVTWSTIGFSPGDTNLMDSTGKLITANLYRSDKPLLGFQLNGHFLVIRGEAYRIASIKDGSSPKTDIYLIDRLPDMPNSMCNFWAIPGYYKDTRAYNNLVFSGDEITFLTDTDTQTDMVVGCTPAGFGTLSPMPMMSDITVVPYKITRTFYYPLNEDVVDIPQLRDQFEGGNKWEADLFAIELYRDTKCIHFGHLYPPTYLSSSYDTQKIPMSAMFIAEYMFCDNKSAIQSNFGKNVALEGQDYNTLDYLSMVRGLWYLFSRARTAEDLKKCAAAFYRFGSSPMYGTLKSYRLFKNFAYSFVTITDDKGRDFRHIIDSIRPFRASIGDSVAVMDYFVDSISLKEGRLLESPNRLETYHRLQVDVPIMDGKESDFASALDRWIPRYLRLHAYPMKELYETLSIEDGILLTAILEPSDEIFRDLIYGFDDSSAGSSEFDGTDKFDSGKFTPALKINATLSYTYGAGEKLLLDTNLFLDGYGGYSWYLDYITGTAGETVITEILLADEHP